MGGGKEPRKLTHLATIAFNKTSLKMNIFKCVCVGGGGGGGCREKLKIANFGFGKSVHGLLAGSLALFHFLHTFRSFVIL